VYEYRISPLLTILMNTCGADSRLAFEITNHPQLTVIDYNSIKNMLSRSKQYTHKSREGNLYVIVAVYKPSNWVCFPIILLSCVNNEKRRQH